MVTSMENEWDYMPAGREKINHGVGAVCKFTLNITDSPYTGMLKNGLQTGLLRISLARVTNVDTYLPSAGIKFLRSGVPSANFVALGFVDIFRLNLTNNIFEPGTYELCNQLRLIESAPVIENDEDEDEENDEDEDGSSPVTQIVFKLLQGDPCPALVGLSDITR